jgi:acyl transferase domain-containing protein
VLAETFTLENALALLAARAKLMQDLPGGSMLAVRLDGKEIEALLPPEISIAARNSSKLCTVSGPSEALKSFQQELETKQIASRFLATSHAFHSAMMDPMLSQFTEIARQTPWAAPKIPWISTCTGAWITAADLADPSYWSRQLRQTVRFADALELALNGQPQVILEVGPGQALSQMAQQHPAKSKGITICSTLDPSSAAGSEQSFILTSLGKLWLAGVKPDWDAFYAGEQRRRTPLPTYPFERKRHWVEPVKEPSIAGQAQVKIPSGAMNLVGADGAMLPPSLLEKVIREQLRLMTEQLDMLQKSQADSAPAAGLTSETSA